MTGELDNGQPVQIYRGSVAFNPSSGAASRLCVNPSTGVLRVAGLYLFLGLT